MKPPSHQTPPAGGYSGKPLHRKLGFRPGMAVRPVDPPAHYAALMAEAEGVSFDPQAETADAVHIFLHSSAPIAPAAAKAIARLRPGGMLWLSWAKKSSPLHAGITEDMLRAAILPLGWVDVKVCALDADWSCLKFLQCRR